MHTLYTADDATCAAAVAAYTGDINEVTANVNFPLCVAVFRFLSETIAALGARGDCDPEVSANAAYSGHTALHHCVCDGRVKALWTAFPHMNINWQDDLGQTALHSAVRLLMPAQVELLLSYGADVDIRDKGGRTADEMERHAWLPDIRPVFAAHRRWLTNERALWMQASAVMAMQHRR